MKKPNLFIVGAPKCATSSLYTYLKQHPQIFMSEKKEPHYFCKDFHEESDKFHGSQLCFKLRSEREYLDLFKDAKDEKILGEASTKYLYSKVAAKEIHDFNPDAKIIIMLRDPVDFLYSLHAQLVFSADEPIQDFEKALEAESERKAGNVPNSAVFPSFLFYSEIAGFSEQIQRYYKEFSKENVKVILFDDLKAKPERVYKEALDFLGVDNTFKPQFEIVNPKKTMKFKRFNDFLRNPNAKGKGMFRAILPRKVRDKIYSFLIRMNKKKAERIKIDSELRKRLKGEYKPEVKKLSELLDRDLITLWDY